MMDDSDRFLVEKKCRLYAVKRDLNPGSHIECIGCDDREECSDYTYKRLDIGFYSRQLSWV